MRSLLLSAFGLAFCCATSAPARIEPTVPRIDAGVAVYLREAYRHAAEEVPGVALATFRIGPGHLAMLEVD